MGLLTVDVNLHQLAEVEFVGFLPMKFQIFLSEVILQDELSILSVYMVMAEGETD